MPQTPLGINLYIIRSNISTKVSTLAPNNRPKQPPLSPEKWDQDFDGLVQDCSYRNALAMGLLWYYAKPSIYA